MSEEKSHLKVFQLELKKKRVAACVIEHPIDLFYLTGMHFSEGSLIVTPTHAKLFVDGRYITAAKKGVQLPVALRESEGMAAFLKSKGCKRLIFDTAKTSYLRYLALKKIVPVKGVNGLLKRCRSEKGREEIARLKKSAVLLWKGFLNIRKSLKVGITEREVAKSFEIFCLEQCGGAVGFEPIIAFGSHSAMPHHHVTDRKLKPNDIVLIDIGVMVDGYHSDMTRVVFFGQPKAKMKRIYEVVHRAQQEALALCRPGVKLKVLDEAVREVFRRERLLKYYPHSLGHGVGLEVHEFPRISINGIDKEERVKPGMVFTIEPGLYIPNEFGVRYEDTIVITDDGYENFYPNIDLVDTIL